MRMQAGMDGPFRCSPRSRIIVPYISWRYMLSRLLSRIIVLSAFFCDSTRAWARLCELTMWFLLLPLPIIESLPSLISVSGKRIACFLARIQAQAGGQSMGSFCPVTSILQRIWILRILFPDSPGALIYRERVHAPIYAYGAV